MTQHTDKPQGLTALVGRARGSLGLRRARRVIGAALVAWQTHRTMRMAAALAFYTTFSFAPTLMIALAVAEVFVGENAARSHLNTVLQQHIGHQGAAFVFNVVRTSNQQMTGVTASFIGATMILVGTTFVFAELKSALNEIWNVEKPPGLRPLRLIRSRLLSFVVVLGIGGILVLNVVASTTISLVADFLAQSIPIPSHVLQTANFALSLTLLILLFAGLYKGLPDAHIAWRHVWFGATVSALLFLVGKFVLGIYLGSGFLSSLYGASGALVIILAWVYYSALAVLFGAEITHAYATRNET